MRPLSALEATRRLRASPVLREVAEALSGKTVFLAGGSLRDRLLGVPTHDLDLAIIGDARATARSLARRFGGRAFSLGRPPLDTWRVAGGRWQLDVWAIPGAVEADIRRRDFTVNALFFRLPRGPLIDLVGGLDDLAAGRLQVVRRENLDDDPLRVLRGLRLASVRPELRLTAAAGAMLAAAAAGLRSVARERIADELGQLLQGPAVERALLAGARLGVLSTLVAGWDDSALATRAARIAGRLALLRQAHGALAGGAARIAWGVLAAPLAAAAGEWHITAVARSLVDVGLSPRTARHVVAVTASGERLAALLPGDTHTARLHLVDSGLPPPELLAWALAYADGELVESLPAAHSLLAWFRDFARRPVLLDGEQIATVLRLPPGPTRAAAARALRRAQASGDVCTAAGARRFLLSWHEP